MMKFTIRTKNTSASRDQLLAQEQAGASVLSGSLVGSAGAAMRTILHVPARKRVNNRIFTLAVAIGAAAILIAVIIAGMLCEGAASSADLTQKNLAPSFAHLFGTDNLGRDMFLRTIAGLSISVRIGLVAALVSSIIALILGCLSALGPKKVDTFITWLVDLMLSVPHIVLLILISYALGKGFWGVSIGVAITHWPALTRVVRAEVLQVKQSGYVAVARKLGATPVEIARKHMLPAVFPQFIVGLILLFPHAILHEAAITFLGFGLPPEMPAIGVILSESMNYLSLGMWWSAVFPGVALLCIVLLFDLVGQNVRRLIDPAHVQE